MPTSLGRPTLYAFLYRSPIMRISDAGVRVPVGLDDRLGLEIQGRRVWAFVPSRDGRRDGDDHRLVPWPEVLRPYLDGSADLVLRSLETQEVLYSDTVSFGDGAGSVELVDGDGRPLSLDKDNHLSPMFSEASDEDRRRLVDTIAEVLESMRSRGHDAFLVYGNLLGAVRDGRLIGHDNDADVAYLARGAHPVDIILESMRIEREFLAEGWRTSRMSGGTFKLWNTSPTGLVIGIDVFVAFYLEGLLHIMGSFAADVPREAVLPTSTVTLEGRELPAPAEPEVVLEAMYGAGWRVPDPTYRAVVPRDTRRRLGGLFRGERKHFRYWETFYRTRADEVPTGPSSFARWVAAQDPRPSSLVDVGSGTGRDAVWLAEQGIRVLGCDYAKSAVGYATERARARGSPATFRRLNLYDVRQMLTAGALLARDVDSDAVYARFLVHALEDVGRENLWRLSRSVLLHRHGRLYLEFRTEPTRHEFGEHFRRFVAPATVCAELASYGFEIEHCEERHGLAVHKSEDPLVCRIIAKVKGEA